MPGRLIQRGHLEATYPRTFTPTDRELTPTAHRAVVTGGRPDIPGALSLDQANAYHGRGGVDKSRRSHLQAGGGRSSPEGFIDAVTRRGLAGYAAEPAI